MAELLYSRSSQEDLLQAWSFVAYDNLAAADRMLDVIDREARSLLDQPLMGRARPELGKGVRSWQTTTPYVLFYLATDGGITIVRVLHHARDVQLIEF